ncbi:MAG: hypothetical protein PUC40_05350 [Lachnospiraceae bacterium]|nr:hypothetical protein [Lachnospiraceae bacterium]
MTPDNTSYLCGGILFTLMLQAINKGGCANDKLDGDFDGISDTDVMASLYEVVTGEKIAVNNKSTFEKETNQFKTCRKYGETYICFTNSFVIDAFTSSVKQKSPDLLKRMSGFTKTYITKTRSEWLVKALFEVIEGDEEIAPDTVFAVTYSLSVPKDELYGITEVELPVFLLSVLSFILQERPDNTKGRSTFESWHSHAGPRSPWKFNSNIGQSITRKISVKTTLSLDTLRDTFADQPGKEAADAIALPKERSAKEITYSDEDMKLLRRLNEDYDEILSGLIGEDYGSFLLDTRLPIRIKELYESKWKSKADSFDDPMLKSYVYGMLGELNKISQSLTDNVPSSPFLKQSRDKIRNLYVRLHPNSYENSFPYDAFIDDWNDGEY